MHKKRYLLFGEVILDQHIDIISQGKSLSRLGGIFHAARCCDAMEIDYSMACYAPGYLIEDIESIGKGTLNAQKIYVLGEINRSPSVMLIGNSDESGSQLYDNILCGQTKYSDNLSLEDVLNEYLPTDVIYFPGRYGNARFISELSRFKCDVHIDINYDSDDIVDILGSNVRTVFLSTSSPVFGKYFRDNSYDDIIRLFANKNVHHLVIKENRGGSWLYDYDKGISVDAPAYIDYAKHSVGVGDVYNIAFLSDSFKSHESHNMILASWISSVYARTLDHEMFKRDVQIIIDNKEEFVLLEGTRVPWNKRSEYPIYLAAPDFDYVNTDVLDDLEDSLSYHNFKLRRPVKENGQVSNDMDVDDKQNIFMRDLQLLSDCKLMIAVLLYNDQGTLVEIGHYHANGKTVILYDPYNLLNNMFLENVCAYRCTTKGQVVNKVFVEIGRMIKDE